MKILNELKKNLKDDITADVDGGDVILVTDDGEEFHFKKDEVKEFLENAFLAYDYRINGERIFVNAEFECYDYQNDYRISEFCKVKVVF